MAEVLARLEQAKKVYQTGDTRIVALDHTSMEVRSHELVLHFLTHGVALFAFTFTTCVAPSTSAGPNGTFAMG